MSTNNIPKLKGIATAAKFGIDLKQTLPSLRMLFDAIEALDDGEEPATITPEQQAVLDAAVAWRTAYGSLPDSTEQKLALAAAVDAMTRPPSVADRLEKWAANPTAYRGEAEDRAAFAALVAEVRALEAGK